MCNSLPGILRDVGLFFRANVMGKTKDFVRATRVAGASGKVIAYGMMVLGLWRAFELRGDERWGGIWLAVIGWFLLNAAQASVAQVTIRETLNGLRASDVMSHEVPAIPANLNLNEYSNEVLRTGGRVHIVTMDQRLVGMRNVAALNTVRGEDWNMNSVQAVMVPRERIL